MVAKGRGGGKTPERVVELLAVKVSKFGQSVVARETGLTRLTIQRYLKGIGEPTQATLDKLAGYFGVSVAWLRGESVWPSHYDFWATLLSSAETLFLANLESSLPLEKNEVDVLLDSAKKFINMSQEAQSYFNHDHLSEVINLAKQVIEKYGHSDYKET